MVAFKLLLRSRKLTPGQRAGMTSRQFVRYHLMHLRLGDQLTRVRRGDKDYLIAPPQEVLALSQELQPTR